MTIGCKGLVMCYKQKQLLSLRSSMVGNTWMRRGLKDLGWSCEKGGEGICFTGRYHLTKWSRKIKTSMAVPNIRALGLDKWGNLAKAKNGENTVLKISFYR